MYYFPTYRSLLLALLAIFISYIAIHSGYEKSRRIRIPNGYIEGFASWSRSGRKYYQFLGIPYAKPPVGPLRFEPPEPVENWNGTLFASSYGSPCIGNDFLVTGRTHGAEDCLFLNVMTPNNLSISHRKSKKYPVIVFIHGGSFVTGKASLYKGTYFMDEDIVLVTLQYRLGIFGFLSTNDRVIPGNMGLKDQVLALKWVKSNIQYFGGDPRQITIMGESAGGTSVHYLMLSPLARGLFNRAISMSCESLFEVFQPHSYNNTKRLKFLENYFNCSLKNTRRFAYCMRSLPAQQLASLVIKKSDLNYFGHEAEFGPVKEIKSRDAFLSEFPLTLLKEENIVNRVPWMVGINQNEGLLIVAKLLQQLSSTKILLKDSKMWNDLIPNLIFYNNKKRPDAANLIRSHYFGNHSWDLDEYKAIKGLSAIITEKLFIKSLVESVKLQSAQMPIYPYVFTYRPFLSSFNIIRWASLDSTIPTELLVLYNLIQDTIHLWFPNGRERLRYGTSHGDELPLLFELSAITNFFTYFREYKMSRLLVKTMADFAHVSTRVKFNNMTWPDAEPKQKIQFMNLKIGAPKLVTDPYSAKLKFWKKLNLPRA